MPAADQDLERFTESTSLLSSVSVLRSNDSQETILDNNLQSYPAKKYNDEKEKKNDVISDTSSKTNERISLFSLPRETKIVVLLCASATFLSSCAFSLPGPFFPQEAAKKGMSLDVSGFVFSVFSMVTFLSSPIICTYLTRIGVNFVFLSGIFVAGLSTVFFGVLDKCPNGWAYTFMCVLTRAFIALGNAALITADYAIITYQCQKAIGVVFSILTISTGAGYMLGPMFGGLLYTANGFGLPFYVMGSLLLLNGLIIYKYLPPTVAMETEKQGSVLNLLVNPLLLISSACLILVTSGMTVYDSTFSIHLQDYGLPMLDVSIMFAIPVGTSALSAPIWGLIVDKTHLHKHLMVTGLVLNCFSWLLAGPSFLLPFLPNHLSVVVAGMLLYGVSNAMVNIPSMKCCIMGANELGYETNLQTLSLTSGLINSGRSLGGFLGPFIGSSLVQEYGYSVAYTAFGSLILVLGGVVAAFSIYRGFRGTQDGQLPADCKKQKMVEPVC